MHTDRRSYCFIPDEIKKICLQEKVKTVSFDLFDTLLVRPSMNPTDIFYLLEKDVQEKYGVSFTELRMNAEQEMDAENANVREIWNWIARKHRLSSKIAEDLMNMEIQLEKQLLTVRPDMYDVMQAAAGAGKRIIITSDTHLTRDVIKAILEQKKISPVEKIYVSCEARKKKNTGELFDYVIENEQAEDPSEIVHIGNHIYSDCHVPLEKGMTAVYYPSIWDDLRMWNSPWKSVYGDDFSSDPYVRLICSFSALHTYLKNGRPIGEKRCFRNLKDMSSLCFGGVLSAMALDMMNRTEIQKGYSAIHFTAIDGYLPRRVYDVLSEGKDCVPSAYLQVSRQALSYTLYEDFFDYYDRLKWEKRPCRLDRFLDFVIVDDGVKHAILEKLTQEEKSLDISRQQNDGKRVLKRFRSMLNTYFEEQSDLAKKYYLEQLSTKACRYIVFDCGTDGLVSSGLNKACKERELLFDQYCIRQTQEIEERNSMDHTNTYCLDQGEGLAGTDVLYEACFSRKEGFFRGFEKSESGVQPVMEAVFTDLPMKQAMDTIAETCEDYAHCFREMFGSYLKAFIVSDGGFFNRIVKAAWIDSDYMELSLLKPIRFADSIRGGYPVELSKKMYDCFEEYGHYKDVFRSTQYRNPEKTIQTQKHLRIKEKVRIGIHVHLHYLHILEELVIYLQSFPLPFDLIITTTQHRSMKAMEGICNLFLPDLQQLRMIPVENRGRDVGPWLVNTREYQKDYDLLCHLHGKASPEHEGAMGDRWRRYLFDNLIERDAAVDMINLFSEDSELGCAFPGVFSEVANDSKAESIPLVGSMGEEQMIEKLMNRLNMGRYFSRDDLLFSAGTMLWYRPQALQPLFDLGLKTEDFPQEPVGVGGTIAHAIERIPALVCEHSGYKARIFNEIPQAVDERQILPIARKVVDDKPKSWKGQSAKWYIKKTIKALFPYGAIRIWQRFRYKF